MDIRLGQQAARQTTSLNISGSKSETNRLLLLQALYPEIVLKNTSTSDDSNVMTKALVSNHELIDIHHAGTAMRFLTAYFATLPGQTVTITGSARMKERPVQILVETLRQLGAEISYVENQGFPPIKITGKKITKNKVSLQANVSSQYISALLLIAPKLQNGLELTLEGKITSIPYIEMTLELLREIGVKTTFVRNTISVEPKTNMERKTITVESDWSSASYFYSVCALSPIGTTITLSSYKQNSLQGDSQLAEIYEALGVTTTFGNSSIHLKNTGQCSNDLHLDLNKTPDIAQTIAVTCFGLRLNCYLSGLHTLKIKETDRLVALKTELTKLGAKISIDDESLTLEASESINPEIKIATYNDHRMAMAFAPLAIKTTILIEDAMVVSKSYPDFWNDMKTLGFDISEIN